MAKEAPAPFDDPDADLVLRSSDNVDFRVRYFLMEMCLPVLCDMLKQPSPVDEETKNAQGIRLVKMEETSTTLEMILSFCYPIQLVGSLPSFKKPFDIIPAVNAARKFNIKILEEVARKSISSSIFATPFEAFIISRRLGWSAETVESAKNYLETACRQDESPVIQYAHAADIVSLSNYLKRCRNSIRLLDDDFHWLATWIDTHFEETYDLVRWLESRFKLNSSQGDQSSLPRHRIHYGKLVKVGSDGIPTRCGVYIPDWLVTEIRVILQSLADQPCQQTIWHAIPRLQSTAADNETEGTYDAMMDFAKLFANVVEAGIANLEPKLDD